MIFFPNSIRDSNELTWLLRQDKSVSNVGDEKTEFLFPTKERKEELMAAGAWHKLGAKPFEDDGSFLSKIKSKM